MRIHARQGKRTPKGRATTAREAAVSLIPANARTAHQTITVTQAAAINPDAMVLTVKPGVVSAGQEKRIVPRM